MGTRLELNEKLCNVFVEVGKWLWNPFDFGEDDVVTVIRQYASKHVFFQQPGTERMEYPCIVYSLSSREPKYADNTKYLVSQRYTVTIIDRNPDSEIPETLESMFQYCRMNQKFVRDNLYHYVYTIYY